MRMTNTKCILKFKQIMRAYQKQKLKKLCKFIRNINKSSAPKAVSQPCLCCVYTVYMYISILYVLVYYTYVFSVPLYGLCFCFMVLNATFSNISVISWRYMVYEKYPISHRHK